jgi:hypothetical protein
LKDTTLACTIPRTFIPGTSNSKWGAVTTFDGNSVVIKINGWEALVLSLSSLSKKKWKKYELTKVQKSTSNSFTYPSQQLTTITFTHDKDRERHIWSLLDA